MTKMKIILWKSVSLVLLTSALASVRAEDKTEKTKVDASEISGPTTTNPGQKFLDGRLLPDDGKAKAKVLKKPARRIDAEQLAIEAAFQVDADGRIINVKGDPKTLKRLELSPEDVAKANGKKKEAAKPAHKKD